MTHFSRSGGRCAKDGDPVHHLGASRDRVAARYREQDVDAARWSKQVILVDTSVWMEHLGSRNATLADELTAGRVLAHPFVIERLVPIACERNFAYE